MFFTAFPWGVWRHALHVLYPSIGTVLLCWHQALHKTWTGYRPPDRSSGLGGRLLSQKWWGEAPLWQSGRPVESRMDRTRQENRFLPKEKKKQILIEQRECLHHYLFGHRCRTSVLSVSAEKKQPQDVGARWQAFTRGPDHLQTFHVYNSPSV